MTTTPPPSNPEAEIALLGSCLMDPACMDGPAARLTPEDFYVPRHAALWALMLSVRGEGKPLDAVTLPREAEARGLLSAIGGPAAVAEALSAVLSPAHADHYAASVSDRSLARKVRVAALEALAAVESGVPGADCLQTAQDGLGGILSHGSAKGPSHVGDAAATVVARMDGNAEPEYFVATPIPAMNDCLSGGYHRGELVIIAGRPGSGKTAWATNCAVAAGLGGHSVLFISMEVDSETLTRNMIASESGVPSDRIRKAGKYLSQEDAGRVRASAETLCGANIHIVDRAGLGVAEIRSEARLIQARSGLDLLIVDYIGLMKEVGRGSREQEMDAFARGLKVMARELAVPVLGLAQLNRQAEGADGQRPRLHHLKDSGGLEAHADVVIGTYRPFLSSRSEAERNEAELLILKNRRGPLETIRATFEETLVRFSTPRIITSRSA